MDHHSLAYEDLGHRASEVVPRTQDHCYYWVAAGRDRRVVDMAMGDSRRLVLEEVPLV